MENHTRNTRTGRHIQWLGVGVFALMGTTAQAASIDVLWYGAESASYNTLPPQVASTAGDYDPAGDGSLDWNVDIWSADEPTPDFVNYDVFIVPSWLSDLNTTRLLAAEDSITAARGTRTFLSGQDADFHYLNSPGAVDDGPRGFFINAVNWAASGSGTGIVALADGWQMEQNTWLTSEGSFLKDELEGYLSYFQEESVNILPGQEGFAVNEGLTSEGLSNWAVSAHMGFSKDLPGYEMINASGTYADYAITMVTEGLADGDTGGGDDGPVEVSEPALWSLFGLGLFALGAGRRRQKRLNA